jgi:preprotein translocase subunit Sec63
MEWLVVIVFFIIGYLAVAAFLQKGPQATNSSGPQPEQARSHDRSERNDVHWFQILGVPQDANAEQIANAYKKKISEYHPDKVASMGVEIRALAEAKSKEINMAYDYAVKLKGGRR